jgi:hypothetical protein
MGKTSCSGLLLPSSLTSTSRAVLVVVGILILATSCAHQVVYPKCRHYAIMQALVFGETFPVRIAAGPSASGTWHAQAQAYIDGEWKWLENVPFPIGTSGKDDFEPQKTLSLEEAIKLWCAPWYSLPAAPHTSTLPIPGSN